QRRCSKEDAPKRTLQRGRRSKEDAPKKTFQRGRSKEDAPKKTFQRGCSKEDRMGWSKRCNDVNKQKYSIYMGKPHLRGPGQACDYQRLLI
uniref:Uncharacterized protein n=1 Tax=Salarias fasciatus TaxID=181472 RepID=A0A672H9K4_SALFA